MTGNIETRPEVIYVRTSAVLDWFAAERFNSNTIYKAILELAADEPSRNPYRLQVDNAEHEVYITTNKCLWINKEDWEIVTEEEFNIQIITGEYK